MMIPFDTQNTGVLDWSIETIRMFQEKDPNLSRLLVLLPTLKMANWGDVNDEIGVDDL